MNKGERVELRSIVRNQFKVLRAEVDARAAELLAEQMVEVDERFAARDKNETDLQWRVNEIVKQANQDIEDALKASGNQTTDEYRGHRFIQTPAMRFNHEDRYKLKAGVNEHITAKVKAARLRLDREEANLLTQLAVGALETAEARSFLAGIPTVGELVPAARLAEIEAQFTDDGD